MRWFVNRKNIDVKEINGIIRNLVRRLIVGDVLGRAMSWSVLYVLGCGHVLESAWRMGAEWMGT